MKKIVATNTYSTRISKTGIYYNAGGPTQAYGDDIYIECKPTGSDGEVLVSQEDTSDDSEKIKNFVAAHYNTIKTIVEIIVGLVIVSIIFKIGHLIFKKIGGTGKSAREVATAARQAVER